MVPELKTLSEQLREARRELDMTLEQISKITGINVQTLARVEMLEDDFVPSTLTMIKLHEWLIEATVEKQIQKDDLH